MKVSQFLEANLWMILAGALALYSGYVTGVNDTKNKIDQMNSELVELRVFRDNVRRFNGCAALRIDRVENGVKGEPPCSLAAD